MRFHALARTTRVTELLDREAIGVPPDMSRAEAAELLQSRGLTAAHVVDSRGHPIGTVTLDQLGAGAPDGATGDGDVVALGGDGMRYSLGRGYHLEREGDDVTVADAMTTGAVYLADCAGVARAAALVAGDSVPILAIVTRHGTFRGSLPASRIAEWVAEMDGRGRVEAA